MAKKIIEGTLNAKGLRFAIVVSRFNDFINAKLLDGCLDALSRHGADDGKVSIVTVFTGLLAIIMIESRRNPGGTIMAVFTLASTWYMMDGLVLRFAAIMTEITGFFRVMLMQGIQIDEICRGFSANYGGENKNAKQH